MMTVKNYSKAAAGALLLAAALGLSACSTSEPAEPETTATEMSPWVQAVAPDAEPGSVSGAPTLVLQPDATGAYTLDLSQVGFEIGLREPMLGYDAGTTIRFLSASGAIMLSTTTGTSTEAAIPGVDLLVARLEVPGEVGAIEITPPEALEGLGDAVILSAYNPHDSDERVVLSLQP